jgi:hypothetical protein
MYLEVSCEYLSVEECPRFRRNRERMGHPAVYTRIESNTITLFSGG